MKSPSFIFDVASGAFEFLPGECPKWRKFLHRSISHLRAFHRPFRAWLLLPFFFAFVKVKFISHILAPYESVILVKRYLVVDSLSFMGVRVLGREIFHVRPNNRIREVLVLLQIYKKAESCKFCNQPFAKNFILKTKELQQKEFTKRLQ